MQQNMAKETAHLKGKLSNQPVRNLSRIFFTHLSLVLLLQHIFTPFFIILIPIFCDPLCLQFWKKLFFCHHISERCLTARIFLIIQFLLSIFFVCLLTVNWFLQSCVFKFFLSRFQVELLQASFKFSSSSFQFSGFKLSTVSSHIVWTTPLQRKVNWASALGEHCSFFLSCLVNPCK